MIDAVTIAPTADQRDRQVSTRTSTNDPATSRSEAERLRGWMRTFPVTLGAWHDVKESVPMIRHIACVGCVFRTGARLVAGS